jgi:hypothetical protein
MVERISETQNAEELCIARSLLCFRREVPVRALTTALGDETVREGSSWNTERVTLATALGAVQP